MVPWILRAQKTKKGERFESLGNLVASLSLVNLRAPHPPATQVDKGTMDVLLEHYEAQGLSGGGGFQISLHMQFTLPQLLN